MNLNQKFSILFWLKKSKMNRQGLVPIWVRITVDGHRATQKQVLPEYWDAEESVVRKDCKDAKCLTSFLPRLESRSHGTVRSYHHTLLVATLLHQFTINCLHKLC